MPDLGLEVLWKGKNFIRLMEGLRTALRISLISALISILAGILSLLTSVATDLPEAPRGGDNA